MTLLSVDRRAFDCTDCERRCYLLKHEILRQIESNGVSSNIQLQSMIKALEGKGPTEPISLQEFAGLVLSCNFVKKVFESRLIIPEYSAFHRNFWEVYREIKADGDGRYSKGTCADCIPSLGKADPSFCSIHGQYSAFGDSMTKFSMQSVSKEVPAWRSWSLSGAESSCSEASEAALRSSCCWRRAAEPT